MGIADQRQFTMDRKYFTFICPECKKRDETHIFESQYWLRKHVQEWHLNDRSKTICHLCCSPIRPLHALKKQLESGEEALSWTCCTACFYVDNETWSDILNLEWQDTEAPSPRREEDEEDEQNVIYDGQGKNVHVHYFDKQ